MSEDPEAQLSESPKSRDAGALMKKMSMEIIETSPARVVARIPVEGNTQTIGLLHGGASAALAETVASIGAWVNNPGKVTLGVDIKVNHLKPAKAGWVTGVGTPLHTGRTLSVWEIRMSNDAGDMTAFATCTIALRDARP